MDESFVSGQELRWAEEGLCTTEDSQLATSFGGQVGNVAFPGKILADSETQKLDSETQKQYLKLKTKLFLQDNSRALGMIRQ